MNQPDLLDKYRQLIDKEIETYSTQLLTDVENTYGQYSRVATEAFTSVLARGGKRLAVGHRRTDTWVTTTPDSA